MFVGGAATRWSRAGAGPTTVLSAAETLWPAPALASLSRRPDVAAAGPVQTRYSVVPTVRRPRYLVPRAPVVAVALRPAQGGVKGLRMQVLGTMQRWSVLHRLPGRQLHVVHDPAGTGIEELLRSIVGDVAHVVVRLGQPRPNRTLVVWAFGQDGAPLAIAKVSRGDEAQAAMETEYAALACEPARDVPRLVAPQALGYVRWEGNDVLVISPLVTRGGRPSHEAPVSQMQALAVSGGVTEQPLRDTAFVERLGREIDALVSAPDRAWLSAGLAALVRDLGDTPVRTGVWHGDWVSWNQSVDGDVVQLWDWEHHVSSVLAGFDHVHFLAQERRGQGTDPSDEDAWLVTADAALADQWGLDAGQRRAVLRGYLLEINLRFVRDRQLEDHAPARTGWARTLVERLAAQDA